MYLDETTQTTQTPRNCTASDSRENNGSSEGTKATDVSKNLREVGSETVDEQGDVLQTNSPHNSSPDIISPSDSSMEAESASSRGVCNKATLNSLLKRSEEEEYAVEIPRPSAFVKVVPNSQECDSPDSGKKEYFELQPVCNNCFQEEPPEENVDMDVPSYEEFRDAIIQSAQSEQVSNDVLYSPYQTATEPMIQSYRAANIRDDTDEDSTPYSIEHAPKWEGDEENSLYRTSLVWNGSYWGIAWDSPRNIASSSPSRPSTSTFPDTPFSPASPDSEFYDANSLRASEDAMCPSTADGNESDTSIANYTRAPLRTVDSLSPSTSESTSEDEEGPDKYHFKPIRSGQPEYQFDFIMRSIEALPQPENEIEHAADAADASDASDDNQETDTEANFDLRADQDLTPYVSENEDTDSDVSVDLRADEVMFDSSLEDDMIPPAPPSPASSVQMKRKPRGRPKKKRTCAEFNRAAKTAAKKNIKITQSKRRRCNRVRRSNTDVDYTSFFKIRK